MDSSDEWLLTGDGDVNPIILHDRMISDSVEYEHSYSNSAIKIEKDLEDECFPAIPISSATGQSGGVFVKEEVSSPPPSPPPYSQVVNANVVTGRLISATKPQNTSRAARNRLLASALSSPPLASLLKAGTQILPISSDQVKVKIEPGLNLLPPTPPSSVSNDSESDGSASPFHPSTSIAKRRTSTNGTTLISCQGASRSGVLFLTEEEKRTLTAEGYPIPQRLPLTKAEERSLKKIRRKIKNKISAQESRRKKKEYVDALEKKVELLSTESKEMRRMCQMLEDANRVLRDQLQSVQDSQMMTEEPQEEDIQEVDQEEIINITDIQEETS